MREVSSGQAPVEAPLASKKYSWHCPEEALTELWHPALTFSFCSCRCGESGHWSSNCPGGSGRGRAASTPPNGGAFTPGARPAYAGRASPGAGRGAGAGRGRAGTGRGIASYFTVGNAAAGARPAGAAHGGSPGPGSGGGGGGGRGTCFKCGQPGHWSSQCGKS
jgi:hypothetical protein